MRNEESRQLVGERARERIEPGDARALEPALHREPAGRERSAQAVHGDPIELRRAGRESDHAHLVAARAQLTREAIDLLLETADARGCPLRDERDTHQAAMLVERREDEPLA